MAARRHDDTGAGELESAGPYCSEHAAVETKVGDLRRDVGDIYGRLWKLLILIGIVAVSGASVIYAVAESRVRVSDFMASELQQAKILETQQSDRVSASTFNAHELKNEQVEAKVQSIEVTLGRIEGKLDLALKKDAAPGRVETTN